MACFNLFLLGINIYLDVGVQFVLAVFLTLSLYKIIYKDLCMMMIDMNF